MDSRERIYNFTFIDVFTMKTLKAYKLAIKIWFIKIGIKLKLVKTYTAEEFLELLKEWDKEK